MIRIALFADIHGKILLPFKLTDSYQRITQKKVDVIFQCGDLGAFPDLYNLDKATLRHMKYDRNELGFHDNFYRENPEIKNYLDQLNINMIAVRGNHEDHDFLDTLEFNTKENLFPIDIYKKIWICKSGKIQTFEKGEETLTFAGIGRIGYIKKRSDKKFIQPYEREEINRLIKKDTYLEVLLTHDKDDSSQRGYGMPEIKKVLNHVYTLYHFHGHTGENFNQTFNSNKITTTTKIKELEFNSQGALPYGCMVILEKEKDHISLEVVSEKITNPFTKENWKFII